MRASVFRPPRRARPNNLVRRFFSQEKVPYTRPTPTPTPTPTTSSLSSAGSATETAAAAANPSKQSSRIDRLLSRTPKFLRRHATALRSAPVTHISAFLILHELTAVVPLLGLAGAFHYYNWLPTYFSEGAWVLAGVEKFGRYFRRKGWISDQDEEKAESLVDDQDGKKKGLDTAKWWNRSEGSVKIVVEFATAYAIVKALLIPRLALSVWAAPWFARWTVIPVIYKFKKVFVRRKA